MHNFLQGLKVVELGHILLGPYTGQSLGDMGADVIKIEAPEGDYYRTIGVKRNSGMGALWMNANRNKRSISIDLKTEEGQSVLRKILSKADVFIHNMRPKAIGRLGFSYEAVKTLNPSIVYCYALGFGSNGPYSDYPAFDDVIQAYCGLTSLNGLLDGQPKMTPLPITDFTTSFHLTQAVLAGVYRKAITGKGCQVEVPMFETMVGIIMNQHINGHAFQPPIADVGYKRVLSAHRKPSPTKDGFIVHGLYRLAEWKKFLPEVGREDILHSELLADPSQLSDNIGQLYQIMSVEVLPQRTTAEWLQLFKVLDIPCAPVLGIEDLQEDPHIKAVGLFKDYEHPSQGQFRDIRSPFLVKDVEEVADVPPPLKGQGTHSILQELDYNEAEIEEMVTKGIVRSAIT